MEGIIVKNISNDYTVKCGKQIYVCRPRGKFRNDNISPMVGDKVIFDEINKYILEILPRKNYLIRPVVANIDQTLIVISVKRPDLSLNLLDKFLTVISFNNIVPIICLTKLDLLSDEEKELINEYQDYYTKIGYQVVTNLDKKKLLSVFKNKVTVLTGQSGSGKSTLLNSLDSSLNLKTDDISLALNRGKHTTRHVELFIINDGYVVDTPGFSALDFNGMNKYDIRDNMNEMFNYLSDCKYRDCMHINEDGCKVRELVNSDPLLRGRYENYLKFIERK